MTTENLSTTEQPPAGFLWGTADAGIRYRDRDDIALALAPGSATVAAVFTRNRFTAAPVDVSREHLAASSGRMAGVVTNAGCANAATGAQGLANARAMAEIAARATAPHTTLEQWLVCSTGTIGTALPMDRVRPGIEAAAHALTPSVESFHAFSRAILTTDTRPKAILAALDTASGQKVRIAACAKGAGMMHPNMATLLAYFFTDATIPPDVLDPIFRRAIDRSLHCMTIDGDTSTNDTACLFASGAAGPELSGADLTTFESTLTAVAIEIAKGLARDGEGATKLIEVHVHGAPSETNARTVAMSIAGSNLVKTAIYGRDANWGRIVCAAGYSGAPVEPARMSVRLGDLLLFENGEPAPLDETRALELLSAETVVLTVGLGQGTAAATAYTCDFSEDYVRINGAYRT